jgi:hypothetical protein
MIDFYTIVVTLNDEIIDWCVYEDIYADIQINIMRKDLDEETDKILFGILNKEDKLHFDGEAKNFNMDGKYGNLEIKTLHKEISLEELEKLKDKKYS